jgi:hypothetical protein
MGMTTAYDVKLEAIDNYLLVSGWTRVGIHWKPPAQIALALRHEAPNWQTAVWRRQHAIMIQVMRDEAAAKEAQAQENKPLGNGKDE